MQFMPAIIVIELIVSSFLITLPFKNNFTSKSSNVLGMTKLAQVDTTSSDNSNLVDQSSPADTPSDSFDLSPSPTDTPADALPTDSPATDTSVTDQASPSSNPDATSGPADTSSPSPKPTQNSTSSSALSGYSSEQTSQSDVLNQQMSTVLNPSGENSNLSSIDQDVIQQVQNQDKQTIKSTTPEAQTQSSLNGGQLDVQVINNSLKESNFANVNFVTQDLSQNIDISIGAINKTSSRQSALLKTELNNFCLQVDATLRSAEEMVSEESEQDMEINRAKCLNVTNQ